jgi:molybdate transport system substrate-binding protein
MLDQRPGRVRLFGGGGSGIYFKNLLDRLGITAQMKSKLRPMEGGTLVVGPVARGEAEIAVITTPFIAMEPGADLVGPLPDELQQLIVYTARTTEHWHIIAPNFK